MKRLVRLLIVVTLALALVPVQPLEAGNEVQANDRIVMQYLDSLYVHRDVDGASALLADNVIIHEPIGDNRSAAYFAENNRQFLNRVQNLKITPYAVIQEGDMVAVPYLLEGTLPTQKPQAIPQPVSGNNVEFFRIADGRIAEIWHQSEFHNFSLLNTSEDYRSTLNMSLPRGSLVEQTGIPALSDMVQQPTIDVLTGMPVLSEKPQPLTLSEQTGIPALAEVIPPAEVDTAVADKQLILNWVTDLNRGTVNIAVMAPTFHQYTCPCDGLGAQDLAAFVNQTRQARSAGGALPWTPVDHERGFTMVSEGGLTALLYDVHTSKVGTHPDSVSIFRVENGLIAEEWSF